MAEIVITVCESGEEVNVTAIMSVEKSDSKLIKDITQIVAPVALTAVSAEVIKFFKHLNEVNHG